VAPRLARRLYNQSIHSAYTVSAVLKTFKALRLDPELCAELKDLAAGSDLMIAEAPEKPMEACVSAGNTTFPTADRHGLRLTLTPSQLAQEEDHKLRTAKRCHTQ